MNHDDIDYGELADLAYDKWRQRELDDAAEAQHQAELLQRQQVERSQQQ